MPHSPHSRRRPSWQGPAARCLSPGQGAGPSLEHWAQAPRTTGRPAPSNFFEAAFEESRQPTRLLRAGCSNPAGKAPGPLMQKMKLCSRAFEAELRVKSRAHGVMRAAGMTWGCVDPTLAQAHAVLAVSTADGPGVVRWVGLQNPVDLTLNLAPASHGWATLGNRFDLSEPQFSHLSNSSYKSTVIKVSTDQTHRQKE